jgi:hypothetical protein
MGQGFLIHEVSRSRITVSRTPLDEWSACRRDLYLTTHNIHNRQTSMPPVGFESTIPAGERPQSYALDHTATGIDHGQTLTFYNSVTIRLKLPDFWLQYFAHSLVSTNPSQGIYRGIEATLLVPLTLYSLKFNNWLTARSWMSLLLSRKQATCRKSPCKNIPLNKGTPAHSCALLYKKENWKAVWTWGLSDLYPCSTRCKCGGHLQVWTPKPLCHFKPNTEVYLPFQFKPAIGQMTSLSPWLPSPRLE